MNLKEVSTQDLVKELLTRNTRSAIKIEVGSIMCIASYFKSLGFDYEKMQHILSDKLSFYVAAESHDQISTENLDEAIEIFFRLWKT